MELDNGDGPSPCDFQLLLILIFSYIHCIKDKLYATHSVTSCQSKSLDGDVNPPFCFQFKPFYCSFFLTSNLCFKYVRD